MNPLPLYKTSLIFLVIMHMMTVYSMVTMMFVILFMVPHLPLALVTSSPVSHKNLTDYRAQHGRIYHDTLKLALVYPHCQINNFIQESLRVFTQKLLQAFYLTLYWHFEVVSLDSGNIVQDFTDVIEIWAEVRLLAANKHFTMEDGQNVSDLAALQPKSLGVDKAKFNHNILTRGDSCLTD